MLYVQSIHLEATKNPFHPTARPSNFLLRNPVFHDKTLIQMRLWHPDQLVHGLEGPHGDGQLDGGNFNFQFNINNFFPFRYQAAHNELEANNLEKAQEMYTSNLLKLDKVLAKRNILKRSESFKIRTEGVGAPLP